MLNSKMLLSAAAAVGVFAGIGAASAADLAARPVYTKAPAPVVVPVTNWSGFYIGGEGGYAWGRDKFDFPDALSTTGNYDTSGGVAGGVIGFNWQAAGGWVFGVEGNFDWANITGSAVCPNITLTCRSNLNEIFTGTGRIGYAWGSAMVYGKGGYAWTNDRHDVIVPATGAINDTAGRTGRDGYTLGAGFEYMFAPNWSAKVEYDYYNFGAKTVSATFPSGAFAEHITTPDYSVNSIKAGINYHFNWTGPVVAKY